MSAGRTARNGTLARDPGVILPRRLWIRGGFPSSALAESDSHSLILELPGNRLWASEIKRGLAPKVEKGLQVALADLKPDKAFLVCSGEERYPKRDGMEATGLHALAEELSRLGRMQDVAQLPNAD